jgi:hypothetical protein
MLIITQKSYPFLQPPREKQTISATFFRNIKFFSLRSEFKRPIIAIQFSIPKGRCFFISGCTMNYTAGLFDWNICLSNNVITLHSTQKDLIDPSGL